MGKFLYLLLTIMSFAAMGFFSINTFDSGVNANMINECSYFRNWHDQKFCTGENGQATGGDVVSYYDSRLAEGKFSEEYPNEPPENTILGWKKSNECQSTLILNYNKTKGFLGASRIEDADCKTFFNTITDYNTACDNCVKMHDYFGK